MSDQTGAAFDHTFADLGREVGRLSRQGRRLRLILLITVASLLLDLVLSIAVWRVAIEARSASRRATTLCEASNDARALQVQLWDYVLSVSTRNPPAVPRTPDEQRRADEQIAQFRTYLHTVFAPRDCSHETLGKTTPTTTFVPTPVR